MYRKEGQAIYPYINIHFENRLTWKKKKKEYTRGLKPSESPCRAQGQSEAFGNAPAERRANPKRSGSSCRAQGQSEAFGKAPAERKTENKLYNP